MGGWNENVKWEFQKVEKKEDGKEAMFEKMIPENF